MKKHYEIEVRERWSDATAYREHEMIKNCKKERQTKRWNDGDLCRAFRVLLE